MPEASPDLKKLYTTKRWRKLRRQQLDAHPWCRYCWPKPVEATVCDHIQPHRGNIISFWSGPFQSLCKHCHDSAKQREERRGRPRLAIGKDGWPEL
jgi:5-methylcytosine-specific restriction protein A